jgi:RNA-binding protein
VVGAVEEAFNTRELLKVRVQEAAPMNAAATGEALAARLPGVHHVQTIGRIVVLYRADPDDPQIRLPGA